MHCATLGHLGQLASISVWTVGLVVQKWLTPHGDIAGSLLLQSGRAATVLRAGLKATGRLPRLDRPVPKPLAWGMFAPGLLLLQPIAGAARTDPVGLKLAWSLIPLLVPVLARLLLGEALHGSSPVASPVGLARAAALIGDRMMLGVGDLTGNLPVLAGVGCPALGQVIGQRLNDGLRPWFQTATLQVTGAALVRAALPGPRCHAPPDPDRWHGPFRACRGRRGTQARQA
jgi:hypothetical protein